MSKNNMKILYSPIFNVAYVYITGDVTSEQAYYKIFPVISAVSLLFIYILTYIATLYLPNYLMLPIWLTSGCIDISFILKLGKITRSFHKSLYIATLIQLNNRDFFYVSISDSMEKLKKKQSYISLLMIDLDNFKNINDTYGHIAGDEILKQLSTILKYNIRTIDIAARWGGDEFVITLPGVNTKDAFNIADRIRSDI